MQEQNIGTCVVLCNSEGKVLLGKRKNAYKAGSFGLPGGRIELNEQMSDAVHREVLEETGIELKHVDYVGAVRENQGKYDFIHFVFAANIGMDEPRLCEPEKCEGWKWFDLEKDFTDSGEFTEGHILPGHAAGIELFINKNRLADLTQ